jgi:hypothetical protein
MIDLSIDELRQLNEGLWTDTIHKANKASNWPKMDLRKLSAVHMVRFKLAESQEAARNAKVSNVQIGKHLEWLWAQTLAETEEDYASLPTRVQRPNEAKPQWLKLAERFQLHAQHNNRRSSSLLEHFHSEWRPRIPTRVPIIGIGQASMFLGAVLYTGSRKMVDSLDTLLYSRGM